MSNKRVRFRNREALLHFVASTEYENGVSYYTDNGKTLFRNNKLYRAGVCIGRIDRETERVFLHIGMHLSGYLWHYQNQLKDAFKHYTAVDVTSFDMNEAYDLLVEAFDRANTKPEYYAKHKEFIIAYETIQIMEKPLLKEYTEQYKKSVKFCKAADKEKEKEEKAYLKALKEYQKECYQAIKKYIPLFLKGKNWNEKLKNFSKDGLVISREEWKELRDLSHKECVTGRYTYQHIFSVNGPVYGRREDGTWGELSEYPTEPKVFLNISVLNDLKGLPDYADHLYIDGEDIHTTRGVVIRDTGGLVRKLLQRFINCKTDKERNKFIGLHVGSYVIREWNPEQLYLQVGCHRFYLKTLKEFADYICSIRKA